MGSGLSDGSYFPCLGIGPSLANIFCVLRIGSIARSTKVEVGGFSDMTAGSIFEIHFPNIRNPATVGTYTWEGFIGYRKNRLLFILNYASFSINLLAAGKTLKKKRIIL